MPLNRRQFLATGGPGLIAAGMFANQMAVAAREPFRPTAGESDEIVFARARERFLFPTDVTYCNTGTLGACPSDVMDAYTESLQELEEALPDWPYFQADGEPLTGYQPLIDVRARVGAFVNADAAEIALTQNATMGMSFIANGLELQAGDEVITTDQEHTAGVGSWRLRAARDGIVVKELPLDGVLADGPDAVVAMFERAITPRTKVLMVSHITSTLGIVLPVRELCSLARAHGILSVIDGAQSIGQIPVDVRETGCDAYVASPHKWLLAPKGTGFMYLRQDVPERIWGTLAGSNYDNWESGAFRFMQFGTGSLPIVHGLVAALDFIDGIGLRRITDWDRRVNERLRNGLAAISSVRIASPAGAAFGAAITTFRVEGRSARELQVALWERKIRVRAQNDHLGVRFCCHLYVDSSDVDRALDVVSALA